MSFRQVLGGLFALLWLAFPLRAADLDPELEKLVGDWEVVKIQNTPHPHGMYTLTIDENGTMGSIERGLVYPKNQLRIDATSNPKKIQEFRAGEWIDYALYKLEGERLIFCRPRQFRRNGEQIIIDKMPQDFTSPDGVIVVNQRVKPAPLRMPDQAIIRDTTGAGKYGSVAFSPTEPYAVIAMGDGSLLIWDPEKGAPTKHVMRKGPSFYDISFSTDGKRLIASSHEGLPAIVFDAQSWKIETAIDGPAYINRFDTSGKYLLTAGTKIEVRTVGDWKVVGTIEPESPMRQIVAGPEEGQWLAPLNKSDKLVVYEFADNQLTAKRSLVARGFQPGLVSYSPETHLAVAAGEHRHSLMTYDLTNDKHSDLNINREGTCRFVQHSPDGKSLVVSYPKYLQMHDLKTGEVSARFWFNAESNEVLQTAAFSSDGRWLASVTVDGAMFWRVDSPGVFDYDQIKVWPPFNKESIVQAQSKSAAQQLSVAVQTLLEVGQMKNVASEQGKPLLSWRVQTLPVLDNHELFSQIQQDQAWNSRVNAPLAKENVLPFAAEGNKPGMTRWLLATGPSTRFAGGDAPALVQPEAKIMLLEVDAKDAVPWSKPEDFRFNPLRPLVGLPKQGFNAVMWDGSQRFIPEGTPAETLKLLFDVSASSDLDMSKFVAPTSQAAAASSEQKIEIIDPASP